MGDERRTRGRGPSLGAGVLVLASCAGVPPVVAEGPAHAPEPPPFMAVAANEEVAPDPVRFLAVGDVMLSRKVAGSIRAAHDPLLPFRALAPLFDGVDFTFANLEGPFSGSEAFADVDDPRASVFNVPPANVAGLVRHRFSLLNLANNHVMDQGPKGVGYTRALLAEKGLVFTGAGATLDEAWEPAFVTVRGVRVGLVGASYCSINDGGKTRNPHVARIEDEDRLARALAKARAGADFVIATMHAGVEYAETPNPAQRRFAEAAVAAGADVVIGAHPHVLEPIDQVSGKLVFYSLGNFVFDHKPAATRRSVAVRLTLSARPKERGKLERVELYPMFIDGVTPRPATPEEARGVLAALRVEKTTLLP